MKVRFYLNTGYQVADLDQEEIVEYEDGTPEKIIREDWQSWLFNIIDSGYEIED